MNSVYAGLEPAEVWRHFAALNNIPRPSGEEAAARDYVKSVAREIGAQCREDARGNIVVSLRSTPENRMLTEGRADTFPVTMIQAHLDMVCQKRPDVMHDFSRDPILPQRDGDIIRASGTTLGADNGIGAALSLALLTTPNLVHGDLELLFTVDEETGLFGAAALDPDLLQAQYLINLDSEDPDELTVGCAGGAGVDLHLPIQRENLDGWIARKISVSGLKGGHSGVQIHEPLGNAIKILCKVLSEIEDEFRLILIGGGSAHNVIPRDAAATLLVAPDQSADFENSVGKAAANVRENWAQDEADLRIETRPAEAQARALTNLSTREVLNLLSQLPHGVIRMSEVFKGKVETSSNLAIVETSKNEIKIHVSSRSFVAAELEKQQQTVIEIGAHVGAAHEIREGYPGWEPSADSRLLQLSKTAFEKTYGKPPSVQVIHAGLECGVILAKNPNMEAISFGPLIRFAHSPDECVTISTVASTWSLLLALLAKIAS